MRKLILLGVPVALLVLGCGGGGSDDVSKWVGNWKSAGTQGTTCNGVSNTTQVSALVVISAGAAAGTFQTFADNCTAIWDVNGSTATLRPGQTCTVTVGTLNATVTTTQGSATLNGATIVGSQAGSVNNGCSYMQQFTLTKM